ncbi:hypothetical protein [Tsukamurella tyrosinosolvens]|uniref:hypothetical protein n=1 Tax=Tsukamurella tyrosinosolvens TaxID=57704 RepID=UPI003F4A5C0E
MSDYIDNSAAAEAAAHVYVRDAMGIGSDGPLPAANTPAAYEYDARFHGFTAGAVWALDELPNGE